MISWVGVWNAHGTLYLLLWLSLLTQDSDSDQTNLPHDTQAKPVDKELFDDETSDFCR